MGVYKFGGMLNNGTFVEIVVDFNYGAVVSFENYVENETHYPATQDDLWKSAYNIIEEYNRRAGWEDEGAAALACDGYYWEEIDSDELKRMSFIGDMTETQLRKLARETYKK